MTSAQTRSTPRPVESRWTRLLPVLLGLAALLPLAVFRGEFQQFFWFGDDWDLLWQISELGLSTWIVRPWAESYSPLFKAIWGSSVFVLGGSYYGMLVLVGCSHAITAAVLAALLRHAGASLGAIALACLVFGLAPTNIETLCWSVQLSPVLANMFFVVAAWMHVRAVESSGSAARGHHAAAMLGIAASALCYSRGVLTGAVLACMSLLVVAGSPAPPRGGRWVIASAYLLPAALVLVAIMLLTRGNQQQLLSMDAATLAQIVEFGVRYFCLNPLFAFFAGEPATDLAVVMYGALKVGVIVLAFRHGSPRLRWLFGLFLLFDLGNAVLLGVGRYHTGLPAAVSSRYQQSALLAWLPLAAFVLDHYLSVLVRRFGPRIAAAISALPGVVTACVLLAAWPAALQPFVGWRGSEPRAALLSRPSPPAGYTVPGIPFLPPDKAQELIRKFDLH